MRSQSPESPSPLPLRRSQNHHRLQDLASVSSARRLVYGPPVQHHEIPGETLVTSSLTHSTIPIASYSSRRVKPSLIPPSR